MTTSSRNSSLSRLKTFRAQRAARKAGRRKPASMPYWEVMIATQPARRTLSPQALREAFADHDPAREEGAGRSLQDGEPLVTRHTADNGVEFCILSRLGDPLIRVFLACELDEVLAEIAEDGLP